MIRTSGLGGLQDKPGGVFLRRTDQMPEADRILLHAVARAVIVAERGLLEKDQIERPRVEERDARSLRSRDALASLFLIRRSSP